MKVLITGASGFIGRHLCQYLQKQQIEVYAITHNKQFVIPGIFQVDCNLFSKEEVESTITEILPNVIIHLAAQSLVLPSWQDPLTTLHTNIDSTVHIVEAIKNSKLQTRIILVGSSGEYAPYSKSILETAALEPTSPYALSKVVQDYLGLLYYRAYNLDIVRVRPFYIIGKGKENDSISDFCRGIVAIESGREKFLSVGNVNVYRDYLDIKDFINALWLIVKKGKKGEVYNICSGEKHKVKEVLKMLMKLSDKQIFVVKDEGKNRPYDPKMVFGNNDKLKQLTWEPRIPLIQSLEEILTFWRQQQ